MTELDTFEQEIADEYTMKAIVLGDQGVGKSTFLQTYIYNGMPSGITSTIGAEFMAKRLVLKNGRKVKLHMWDTAGAETYRAISKSYMRDTHIAFFAFDLTDFDSWTHLVRWKMDIDKVVNRHDGIPMIVLLACKSDLPRHEVTLEDIITRAKEWDCTYSIITCKKSNSPKIISNIIHGTVEEMDKVIETNIKDGIEVPSVFLKSNKTERYVDFYKPTTNDDNCCNLQ
jgi:small GTP-binding protein